MSILQQHSWPTFKTLLTSYWVVEKVEGIRSSSFEFYHCFNAHCTFSKNIQRYSFYIWAVQWNSLRLEKGSWDVFSHPKNFNSVFCIATLNSLDGFIFEKLTTDRSFSFKIQENDALYCAQRRSRNGIFIKTKEEKFFNIWAEGKLLMQNFLQPFSSLLCTATGFIHYTFSLYCNFSHDK